MIGCTERVESEGHLTFGALIEIGWPKLGGTAKDVLCRSFPFLIDGRRADRVPCDASGAKHDRGELMLNVTQRKYTRSTQTRAASASDSRRSPGRRDNGEL
jgi:hypothetical protein